MRAHHRTIPRRQITRAIESGMMPRPPSTGQPIYTCARCGKITMLLWMCKQARLCEECIEKNDKLP